MAVVPTQGRTMLAAVGLGDNVALWDL